MMSRKRQGRPITRCQLFNGDFRLPVCEISQQRQGHKGEDRKLLDEVGRLLSRMILQDWIIEVLRPVASGVGAKIAEDCLSGFFVSLNDRSRSLMIDELV